jgi:hypothetical protein
MAFLKRDYIQVIVKYLIFIVNSIHVNIIDQIIPQFDDIVVKVDVALNECVKSWFQNADKQLIFNLCFEDCPLICYIEQFESVDSDTAILTRSSLFWKDQKAIVWLIHTNWFYLFNSVSVFDYIGQLKRRELDVYFHNVLCNGLLSPHCVLVTIFVEMVSKKDEALVRDRIESSWMTFGYCLEFAFLAKIAFLSPRVDFCFVMEKNH